MKIKHDFVTNSSTACYILNLNKISVDELLLIKKKVDAGKMWHTELNFVYFPSDADAEREFTISLGECGIEMSRGDWRD